MKVALKYGTKSIALEVEKTLGFIGVLTPSEPEPLPNPMDKVFEGLQKPIEAKSLAEVARGRRSVCVVISDITRPVPNALILPPILEVIRDEGIPDSAVNILIATGMHRPSTQEEKIRLVGQEISKRYKVIDHLSRKHEEMVEVGKIGENVPALVNRLYIEAELKILTGFIEPHMWAGYSGGRKAILPGISSIETLQFIHGPEMIGHPKTAYGELEGNPIHESGLEVMKISGCDFIVNVTMNTKGELTGVFSGHPVNAHIEGCHFLAGHCKREVETPLDFIVTSNSGAPLDCNLYQTTKGITAAADVVKPKGDILIASRCNEGVGSIEYRRILEMVDSPRNFLDRIMRKEFFIADQWCAQETYQVLQDKNVWIYSEGLSAEELNQYHFHAAKDIGNGVQTLLKKHGHNARWAIVPDGPMVILKLRKKSLGAETKHHNS